MLREIQGSAGAGAPGGHQQKGLQAEVDLILRPLMDFLDNQLSMLAEVRRCFPV